MTSRCHLAPRFFKSYAELYILALVVARRITVRFRVLVETFAVCLRFLVLITAPVLHIASYAQRSVRVAHTVAFIVADVEANAP